MATEAEGEEFEVDPMDEDDEDETYDRETEEFYSNIQDVNILEQNLVAYS